MYYLFNLKYCITTYFQNFQIVPLNVFKRVNPGDAKLEFIMYCGLTDARI
jgi:hypothetical protein